MIFSGLLVSITSWPDGSRWIGYLSFCKYSYELVSELPFLSLRQVSFRARRVREFSADVAPRAWSWVGRDGLGHGRSKWRESVGSLETDVWCG
eukprot:996691-Rhodomonas_salina.1